MGTCSNVRCAFLHEDDGFTDLLPHRKVKGPSTKNYQEELRCGRSSKLMNVETERMMMGPSRLFRAPVHDQEVFSDCGSWSLEPWLSWLGSTL
jgi:hypothetical protein